jgi:hypothetical protein
MIGIRHDRKAARAKTYHSLRMTMLEAVQEPVHGRESIVFALYLAVRDCITSLGEELGGIGGIPYFPPVGGPQIFGG